MSPPPFQWLTTIEQRWAGVQSVTPSQNLRIGCLVPTEGGVELLNSTIISPSAISPVRLGPGGININRYAKFVNDFIIEQGTSIQIGSASNLDLNEDTGSKKSIITNAGEINLTPGPYAAIMTAFGTEVTLAGHGTVFLGGDQSLMTAKLGGSFINSAGHIIRGAGTIDAPLENRGGIVVAENGTLAVLGLFTHNEGRITTLKGGTFDIKGQELTNRGWIDGYGELNMGGFINEDTLIQHADSKLSISGNVTNNGIITPNYSELLVGGNLTNTNNFLVTGGSFKMRGNLLNTDSGKMSITDSTLFYVDGDATNEGILSVKNSNFEVKGTFKNNNRYTTDPSTNIFGNLIVGEKGYLEGDEGDLFLIRGDFINQSTQNNIWKTENASLIFESGDDNLHKLFIAGTKNDFAWGSLDLSGQMLELGDGDGTPGGALYVRKLLGVTFSDNQVNNISGNSLNIFYDLSNPENAYLGGGQFKLGDDAYLMPANPVPLPSTLLLMGSGLLGLGAVGWRRKRG